MIYIHLDLQHHTSNIHTPHIIFVQDFPRSAKYRASIRFLTGFVDHSTQRLSSKICRSCIMSSEPRMPIDPKQLNQQCRNVNDMLQRSRFQEIVEDLVGRRRYQGRRCKTDNPRLHETRPYTWSSTSVLHSVHCFDILLPNSSDKRTLAGCHEQPRCTTHPEISRYHVQQNQQRWHVLARPPR